MASIDKYLKDPEYTNWVKSGLALNITHEVLRPFVVKEITKLHQSIVKKLPPGVSCGGCSVNSGCPNGICDKIQHEIENKHWYPIPSFTNTSTGRWSTEPWEIAKCYMPPFKEYRRSSASDADFSASINVIINCRHFLAFGTSNPNIKETDYSKSRDFRNRVMHAGHQKVTEKEMRENLDILINILNKIKTPETEDDTKEAIAKIQKTIQMKITIGDAIEMGKNATEASANKPKKDEDQVQRERMIANFEAGCRKALCRITEEHISKQKGNLSVAAFLSKIEILAVIKNLCSKHKEILFPEYGTHEDIGEWDLFVYCFILEELDLSEPLENAVIRFVHEVKKVRNNLLLDATGKTQDDLSELCNYLIDTDLDTEITDIFNKVSPDVDVIRSYNSLVSWWRQEEEYGNKQDIQPIPGLGKDSMVVDDGSDILVKSGKPSLSLHEETDIKTEEERTKEENQFKGAPTKMAEAPIETDAQPLQPRSAPREETSIVPKEPLYIPPIPDDYHFNKLLLEIGKRITDDDLDDIKCQYEGELKTRTCNQIKSPKDLFRILKQRRYISPENVFHLQAIVMMIDDNDVEVELMGKIYEYSRKHKAVFFRPSTDEPPNGFRRLKFHVKGLEHYQQFNTETANTLKIRVASLTGINTGDVLLDGIQLTNSIYVTLLIPGRHYILFSALLKKGIPLLTELKIDMVTFEDGTTIKASDGSQIIEELPPIRESPDETIQRLKEVIDELESKNICYRKQIEEPTPSDVSDDSSHGSSHDIEFMNEAMNEAIEKLELKELQPWQLDRKNDEMPKTLTFKFDIYDSGFMSTRTSGGSTNSTDEEEYVRRVGSNDAPGNCRKESSVGDDRGLTDMKSTNTTDKGEDEVILSCDAQTRHFMEEAFQQQLNNLAEKCRVLCAEITNKNATLQIALPVIDFKHGLMQQLETIFESKGETIPTEKGYKENVIKLAIDLSRAISHEEGKTLETGYKDVKITTEVKRDRSFLLLRLFYLENLTSDAITLIENFVSKKLSIIGRKDLLKKWIDAVMPKSHRSRSRP